MSRRCIASFVLAVCVLSAPHAGAACEPYFTDRAETELPVPLDPDDAADLSGLAQSGHPCAPLATRLLAINARLVPSFPVPLVLSQGSPPPAVSLKRFYTVRFRLPAGAKLQDFINQHVAGPGVVRAAPVPRGRASTDPYLGASRVIEYDNATKPCGTQWYLHASRVPEAWTCATGDGVEIAVVDWGFFTGHPDLAGKLDMAHAYNACDNSSTLKPGSYDNHGTGTAGLVAARKKGEGIQGVAFDAKVWPVQAACSTATSEPCDVKWPDWNPWATGIAKVALTTDGPMVLALETQTCCKGSYEASIAVQGAILVASSAKVLVVMAAGNGGRDASIDDDGNPILPTDAIVVGATDYDDVLLEKSNHGDRVTVSAPGDPDYDLTLATDGVTCGPAGYEIEGYTEVFGLTSGATAKVAGVVGLMLQRRPTLTAAEAKSFLGRGTPAENSILNRKAGFLLDAAKALAAADPEGCPFD